MKKGIALVFASIALVNMVGCSGQNIIHDDSLVSKEISLVNYVPGYTSMDNMKLTCYFKDNINAPYIGVENLLETLSGYYDYSAFNWNQDVSKNTYTLSLKANSNMYMVFNYLSDSIYLSNLSFTDYLLKPSSEGSTSYNLKVLSSSFSIGSSPVTYSLADYSFDIISHDNQCLVPLSILNMVMNSDNYMNLIYNGEKIFSVYSSFTPSSEHYEDIYNCSLNGRSQSKAYREANLNSLCFLMDYFYGLKEFKGFAKFRDYIPETDLSSYLSTDSDDNIKGTSHLLYNYLNDPHTLPTTIGMYSNYVKAYPVYASDTGKKRQTMNEVSSTLEEIRKNSIVDYSYSKVRYSGDTAIITLPNFQTGTYAQIYNDDYSIKEDAYKYDSYIYMRKCLDEVNSHDGINYVLIDVSLNGGGNVGALYRVMGFLKNDDVHYVTYNTLSKRYSSYHYSVDLTGKGDYSSNQYSKYKYAILSSEYSFSCANRFLSIAKEQKIAKIIGQKSSGGMCTVLPSVLLDGSFLTISSPNQMVTTSNEKDPSKKQEIESGVEVDYSLDYEYFYNDGALEEAIHNVYSD